MSLILALRKQSQEDLSECKASLVYKLQAQMSADEHANLMSKRWDQTPSTEEADGPGEVTEQNTKAKKREVRRKTRRKIVSGVHKEHLQIMKV